MPYDISRFDTGLKYIVLYQCITYSFEAEENALDVNKYFYIACEEET